MKNKSISQKKIFLVTNIPTPYRIPLFNELNKKLLEDGIKLKVIFSNLGYSRRKWIINMSDCLFDYEFLYSPKIKLRNPEKVIFTYKNIIRIIKRESPEAIITPGFSLATTKLFLVSLLRKTRYIIWSGAIISKNKKDSLIRRIHRKLLIKKAAGFIAYGTRAKEYLALLGVDPEKISIAINTVDVKFFKYSAGKKIIHQRIILKSLLYVGYFVKRKRIDLLFFVIKKLLEKRSDFILRLVGGGPDQDRLINLVRQLNIEDYVRFEGFKQKNEIIKYFADADCLLFPSDYDVWGLVLVEAMAAGLPCISSVNAGASYDLIIDGVTGFSMDFNKVEEVSDKIGWILDNPELSSKIGRNAQEFIFEKATLDKSAQGFVKAIQDFL